MIDVCVLGAERPDAAPFLWALRVLGATVSTEPCDARRRVLFGPLDESLYGGAKTIFVPTYEDLADPDPQLLDRPGLWIVPTSGRVGRLTKLATTALHTLVLPWSHWTPVRDEPLALARPAVALGDRGKRVAVPVRCAPVVPEGHDASFLVAPSSLTTLMSALHRGMPVVDFLDSPLADCISRHHDGMLFPRDNSGSIVERLFAEPDLLRRLTCPHPGRLIVHQQRFIRLIRDHALGHPPTRVRFFRRPHREQRRAMGYRIKIIRDFGIQPTWSGSHEFTLVGGRVPVEHVKELAATTDRPVILAMGDAIHDEDRLEWFRGVARSCQMLFVADPPALLPRVECPVSQLHVLPNGAISRPATWPVPPEPEAADILFLANTWYPHRIELVQRLARHFHVVVCGRRTPDIPGVERRPHIDPVTALESMRAAKVTLSASIRADRELTSNRLFTAGAAGACILAEEFPNCRTLYPDSAVRWFSDLDDAVDGAMELLDMDTTEMRWSACEITWRRHTAHDRMLSLLRSIDAHLDLGVLWRDLEDGEVVDATVAEIP